MVVFGYLWLLTVSHQELYSILSNKLNGRSLQKNVYITDSFCCSPETNTTL